MPLRTQPPLSASPADAAQAALGGLPPHLVTLEESIQALKRDSDPSGLRWHHRWEEIDRTLAEIRALLAPALRCGEAPPPLDPNQLAILREEGLLESLTTLFEEMVERTFEQMNTALLQRDSKTLSDAAHLLKGSAVNFGAATFATTCQIIEQQAATMQPAQLESLLDQLRENHHELMEALREEIGKR